MFGLDILTAGSLLIMASSSADFCQMNEPTEINVVPRTREVRFDTSKTLAEIQNQATDTINPYGFHDVTQTQGFMKGIIKVTPRVKLAVQSMPAFGQSCLWYDSITVELEIDPTVVIAKEVYADSCMRHAVKEHEMKHVKVDREIVNKYARSLGKNLYRELSQRGFKVGPIPSARQKEVQARMQETVFQIVDHEYKKMELERVERQRAIDSREEYERVDAMCPDSKTHTSTHRSAFSRARRIYNR